MNDTLTPPPSDPAGSRAKARFLSHVGHELRTPLNAVLGFTQLMRSDIEAADVDTATQLRQLGFVEQAGWQLLSMVDSLLETARLESGRFELEMQDGVELAGVLMAAAEAVRATAESRMVSIETVWEPDLQMRTDPARLARLLERLLRNGVDYNEAGGRVLLSAASAGGAVRLTVADSGRGIEPEQMAHLFDPFARPGNLLVDGAGMSLPIVKGVAELMGGTVAVQSTPGQGTVVTIELPR